MRSLVIFFLLIGSAHSQADCGGIIPKVRTAIFRSGTSVTLRLGLGYVSALALSRLFAARTSIALPVTLSLTELRLVLAIIAIGLVLAIIPAALTYRGSVGAALRS